MVGAGRSLLRKPFHPAQLPNLSLWLDPSRIAGLVDADPVATWSDLSGNGRHAIQATGAKQPTLKTGIVNGRPVVRFDGTDDLLVIAGAPPADLEGTVVAVFKLAVTTGTRSVFSSSDEASNNRYVLLRSNRLNVDQITVQQANSDTDDVIQGGTALGTTLFRVVTVRSSGAAYGLYLNGAVETPSVLAGADTGDWFGDVTGPDNIVIGAAKYNAEADFFSGDLAELLWYSRSLASTELSRLHRWLGQRYALAVTA